ncbi:MAG TPA: alpha/beta fold hydrolase [Mycobacteriales bacterium]
MATEFVTSGDGTRIAYERSGAGPVLVLVDGAAMHRAFGTSRGLARLLADAFTVVTYDRRGRGESGDTPPWSPVREVEDLMAVIRAAMTRAATSGREDGADGGVAVHTLSSGAVLALHAVAAGAPIRSLSLFEPPIDLNAAPDADTMDVEAVALLVRAGRRREAVQAFQAGIGMPAEMIAGQPPEVLDALDAVAPTLVYDLALTRAGCVPPGVLAAVRIPVLVLSSDTGSGPLGGWAAALAAALPAAQHRTLPGSWHGVPEDLLAGAIRDAANHGRPAARP